MKDGTNALPAYFKAIAIGELFAYALVGGISIFGLSAMLPYGEPQPSANVALLRFSLVKVALPLAGLAIVIALAFMIFRQGPKPLAIFLILAPLPLLPMYFVWCLS